jgi:hypothetical protein
MLTACGGIANVIPVVSGGRFYSEQEMALVSRVSDLIIPRTDTPGALDANVPGLLDGLMAEWANAETQSGHHQMLAQLGSELDSRVGGEFATSTASTAESALQDLDAAAFLIRDGYAGYRNFKVLISQAYFSTQEGALQEQGWVAAPGRWDPCVEL